MKDKRNEKVEMVPCVSLSASCKDVYDRNWGFTFFVKTEEVTGLMFHTLAVLQRHNFNDVGIKKGEVIFHMEEDKAWDKDRIENCINSVVKETWDVPYTRKYEM